MSLCAGNARSCSSRSTVAPSILFGDYPYLSSYSDTMLRHAEALARSLTEHHALGPHSLVVEIGSNDGYLLQYFRRAGIGVLGIDPAGPRTPP